jgi:hypothetical protein
LPQPVRNRGQPSSTRPAVGLAIVARMRDAHQRGLARAIRPEEPEYAGLEREIDSAKRLNIAAVVLAEIFDRQLHGYLSRESASSRR